MGEKKTLIWAVVIILIAIVLFKFGYTGQAAKTDVSTITVSPTKVTFDKYDTQKIVMVTITPGSIGIDNGLILYRESGERAGKTMTACTSHICNEKTVRQFSVSVDLPAGKYFFRGERDNYDQAGHDLKFDSNLFEIVK